MVYGLAEIVSAGLLSKNAFKGGHEEQYSMITDPGRT